MESEINVHNGFLNWLREEFVGVLGVGLLSVWFISLNRLCLISRVCSFPFVWISLVTFPPIELSLSYIYALVVNWLGEATFIYIPPMVDIILVCGSITPFFAVEDGGDPSLYPQ